MGRLVYIYSIVESYHELFISFRVEGVTSPALFMHDHENLMK